jgi:hypothetical protein
MKKRRFGGHIEQNYGRVWTKGYPMTTQAVGGDEALVAKVADKRPVAGVGPHVGLELVSRDEPAVAEVAHVRPLSRVDPAVHLELVVRDEALVADRANERPTTRL